MRGLVSERRRFSCEFSIFQFSGRIKNVAAIWASHPEEKYIVATGGNTLRKVLRLDCKQAGARRIVLCIVLHVAFTAGGDGGKAGPEPHVSCLRRKVTETVGRCVQVTGKS